MIDWMCSPSALRTLRCRSAPCRCVLGDGLVENLDNRVEDVHAGYPRPETATNCRTPCFAKCRPFLALDFNFLGSASEPFTVSLCVATVGSTSKCPSSGLRRTSTSPPCSQSLSLPSCSLSTRRREQERLVWPAPPSTQDAHAKQDRCKFVATAPRSPGSAEKIVPTKKPNSITLPTYQ